MALQKSKELLGGNSGNYWKVTHLDVDLINNRTVARISLFKDKAARDAGKTHIHWEEYLWKGAPFTVANMDTKNPIKIAYEELKKKETFTGATDV